MRSAEARLGVVESIDSAMRGVGRTWEMMSVPRKAVRWGAIAGGSMLGLVALRSIFGGRRQVVAPVAQAVEPRGVGSSLVHFALQMLPVLLAPWLKSRFLASGLGSSLGNLHPGHLFFRWLGLDK